uniref:Uncharacterized protein n=1 Tax=Arundo donax TaxID=35708 RepID=A0A0A9B5W1_ARUDO
MPACKGTGSIPNLQNQSIRHGSYLVTGREQRMTCIIERYYSRKQILQGIWETLIVVQ